MENPFGGFCPVEIYFVNRTQLQTLLLEYEENSIVVLVLDRELSGLLELQCMTEKLALRYNLIWIDRVKPNPVQSDIADALGIIRERVPVRIIAVGGGSAIDLAKAVSAFHGLFRNNTPHVEEITCMIRKKSYRNNPSPIPITAIPTTAGTGSELTKWATVWDVNKQAKFSVDDLSLYPQTAIIVPELTYSMPKMLILSTALDALSHAMEAFWAKPSTPVVRDVAVMAMIRIRQNLKKALEQPLDGQARVGLSRGSTLAGMAFSNTRTTACHSMSYPMTMLFGIDHGFACAMTLREVARINRTAVSGIAGMLDEVFGGMDGFDDWMNSVCEGIQALRLSAFGVTTGDIPRLVGAAFTGGRMDNNPVDLTPKQVEGILKRCL